MLLSIFMTLFASLTFFILEMVTTKELTKFAFVEFSADTLIIDEYDQCDRDNLAKGYDRLRASPNPKFFR